MAAHAQRAAVGPFGPDFVGRDRVLRQRTMTALARNRRVRPQRLRRSHVVMTLHAGLLARVGDRLRPVGLDGGGAIVADEAEVVRHQRLAQGHEHEQRAYGERGEPQEMFDVAELKPHRLSSSSGHAHRISSTPAMNSSGRHRNSARSSG